MRHVDKILVTNISALRRKYPAGMKVVTAAIDRMAKADGGRGLTCQLVAVDDASVMRRLGCAPVVDAADPKQNKEAVDAIFNAYVPDYLVLLGAIDVIPHQDLDNPVKDDDDPLAYGDLPYACSAPYSQRIEDFRGPTRVVGRLPDVVAASDPSYFVKVIDTAAGYKSSDRSAYQPYLGMTARVWEKSTAESLNNTFGSAAALQQVPPKTARWPAALLKARSHFINCHGGPADPHFYGQQGSTYPIAHDAAYLAKRVKVGTVVSAECCYGAELYDPALAAGQMGICNTYLGNGAYGFFGSSTTAYGPSEGNGSADLLCQYFLQRMLAGSSLGRAVLEARQRFVQTMSVLDPADLKTLAQFSLMGDPSVHPVAASRPALAKTRAYKAALPDAEQTNRGLRRERLTRFGLAIGKTAAVARERKKAQPRPAIRSALEAAGRETGVGALSFASFAVHDPADGAARKGKAVPRSPSAFHVAVGRDAKRATPARKVVLLIATEVAGKIVRLRRLHAR